MRAMGIGITKSGSTTLHRACKRSGLQCAHFRAPDGRYLAELIYESFRAGQDPFKQLSGIDVITDVNVCNRKANYWPNLDLEVLHAIRAHHPKCLLILNRRDPKKLVASISKQGRLRKRMTEADIIGLPKGCGDDDDQLRKWIAERQTACASAFSNDPYFLDLDIEAEDVPKRLGTALGIEVRWWGIANSAEERTLGERRPAGVASGK